MAGTLINETLRQGWRAMSARPRLTGAVVAASLCRDLLMAAALAAAVTQLAGGEELALAKATSADWARLAMGLLDSPEKLSSALGLILTASLLGRLVSSLALGAALAGIVGGREGSAVAEAGLIHGPRLFLLSIADGTIATGLLLTGGMAAISALAVSTSAGATAGAVAFALVMGPAAAGLLVM